MRVAYDILADRSQSAEKHIIPVLDKSASFPTKGALLYNTSIPPDIIHYADGTQWIPLATGGQVFPVINEGVGTRVFDDLLPPSAPPEGYKMRAIIPDVSIGNEGISVSLSGTNQEVQIGNTLTGANIGPASGPTVAEIFSGKAGNQLQMKKLVAGMNISLTDNPTNIVIDASPGAGGLSGINNEGGGAEIFDQIIGSTAILRTLVEGADISIVQNPTTITISNSSPASSVTLTSAGGTETLVNDGTGPSLATKGLTAGTGISLTPSGTDITISSTGGGASSNSYIFSYDTTFQPIVTPNTFQDITFNTNGILNGWTHILPTATFVCPTTGVYSVTAVASFSKTTGANRITSVMIGLNGNEIPGSQTVGYMEGTNQSIVVDLTNFIASINAGDILQVMWTSDGTTVTLDPTIGSSTIGVIPSAKLSILRIA